MWQPSRVQWWVIWLTAIPALLVWLASSNSYNEGERMAASIVIVGGLLFWRFSVHPPDTRIVRSVIAAVVGVIGLVIVWFVVIPIASGFIDFIALLDGLGAQVSFVAFVLAGIALLLMNTTMSND